MIYLNIYKNTDLEENENLTSNRIEEVEKLISDGKIKYIFSDSNESNATVNTLINKHKIELIKLNTMHSIDGEITNSNDDYISIMTNNINLLKRELYK